MLRLTALAVGIAVTVGACTGSDQRAANVDSAMGSVAESGAARVDSAARGATSAVGGALDTLGAKADTAANTMGAKMDTAANTMGAKVDTAADKAKSAAGAAAAAVGSSASSAALRVKLTTLSEDQVKQLQTALTNDGCDAGQADGAVGSKTIQAVKCGLQKHNISDNDTDALYQALNLNFGS